MHENKELQKFSFTPRINKSNTFFSMQAPEDVLLGKYEEQQQKLEKMKSQNEQKIHQECPFMPKISKKSQELVRRSRSVKAQTEIQSCDSSELLNNTDIFNSLYILSQRNSINKSLAVQQTNCTFHPKILGFQTPKMCEYTQKPVISRLLSSKATTEQKLQKIREQTIKNETTIDKNTGQILYKPKVCRGPRINKHDPKKPIHENLYNVRYLEQKKLEAQNKDKKRWQELSQKKDTIENSLSVLNLSRNKKLNEVFKLLDPDSCGTISKRHVKLDCIFPPDKNKVCRVMH